VGRLAALTALWLGLLASPALPTDHRVTVSVFDYRPNAVTINPGDSVTWRWTGPDTNHSVTAARGAAEQFDSDPGRAPDAINHEVGATFRHTFTKPGVLEYVCRVHPRFMRGAVVVRAVPDHVAPRIRSLRAGARRLCARGPRSCRNARLHLRFRLSERARLRAEIRRIGAPGSATPVRTLRFTGRRGRNDRSLAAGLLRPARYRLTVTAADAVGNVSKPARAQFAVRRPTRG
jgi:plastocyanin